MIKHWNEFQGSPNRVNKDKPRVSLNSRGLILLNRQAFEAMDTPAAVTLLFDENNNIIGLKTADPRRTNAFPVKRKDRWHNHTVSASPFIKHHNIHILRTVLFNEIDIDNEGVLKLELTKTTTIGRGRW